MNYKLILFTSISVLSLSWITKPNKEFFLNYQKENNSKYIIKEKVFNTPKNPYKFLKKSEKLIELKLNKINKKNSYDFQFTLLKLKKFDATYSFKEVIKEYDSEKKEAEMKTVYEQYFHRGMKQEYNKPYLISIDNKGNIIKQFTNIDGSKPNSGVYNMEYFQLIFSDKNLKPNDTWTYTTNEIKKTILFLGSFKDGIHLEIKIESDNENVINGSGKYILNKKTLALEYCKINLIYDKDLEKSYEIIRQ